MTQTTILRAPAVCQATGYPRTTLYRLKRQGLWPKPVKIGARAVGWPSNEVTQLIDARVAGRSDSEIRSLVLRIEAARQRNAQREGQA